METETINGYPVIASAMLPEESGMKPARVILVRGNDKYITAQADLEDEGWYWYWGHYFKDYQEACFDFCNKFFLKTNHHTIVDYIRRRKGSEKE